MTVYKMEEVVGTSATSVTDAIVGAIERAGSTFEEMQWFEVKEIRGRINEDKLPEYQVRLNLGFTLKAPEDTPKAGGSNRHRETPSRKARSTAAQIAAKGGQKKRSDLAKGFEKQGGRQRTK